MVLQASSSSICAGCLGLPSAAGVLGNLLHHALLEPGAEVKRYQESSVDFMYLPTAQFAYVGSAFKDRRISAPSSSSLTKMGWLSGLASLMESRLYGAVAL